ncbi:hypothetical protein MVEN_00987800 [Mycena venus]|uniref:Uncharacterized protein n=1 Tax=Mycena venus TaxID=2733690 RepID=A0A8H6YDJ9_9AGAR|nr:hypothetical protein MVEN_00987800 [Mycena venus]
MSGGILLDVELSLRQLSVFNSLFTVGLVLLVVVIGPAIFSRNVRRSPLWFAFMGSWLFYCISGLLLVGHQLGPDPPFGICLFQAALIHSVPTLGTVAGACFIVDLYCTLRVALLRSYWIPMRRTPTLLAFPAVAFLFLFFLSLGIGLQDHTTVNRVQSMFCHVNTGLPTLVGAILSGFAMLIAIGIEIAAAIMIFRNRRILTAEKKSPLEPSQPPIARSMVIRIFMFSLLTVLGLGLSTTMLFHFADTDIQGNYMLPILPLMVAVLFGAQRDIILGWRFWKQESKAPQVGAV